MKISEIFEDEPTQWGLRGDPFLWRELKEKFKDTDMPSSPIELKTLLEQEYENSTGYPSSHKKHIHISRFSSQGMSSGSISPDFWVTTGIPLLVSRHAKL